jgi:hypothetical protein
MYEVGENLILSLKLFDDDGTKFVRAKVYDPSGSLIYTQAMPHIQEGLYQDNSNPMTGVACLTAVYQVFDDAGFTIESANYLDAHEVFRLDDSLLTNVTIVKGDEVVITAQEDDKPVVIAVEEEEIEIIKPEEEAQEVIATTDEEQELTSEPEEEVTVTTDC